MNCFIINKYQVRNNKNIQLLLWNVRKLLFNKRLNQLNAAVLIIAIVQLFLRVSFYKTTHDWITLNTIAYLNESNYSNSNDRLSTRAQFSFKWPKKDWLNSTLDACIVKVNKTKQYNNEKLRDSLDYYIFFVIFCYILLFLLFFVYFVRS